MTKYHQLRGKQPSSKIKRVGCIMMFVSFLLLLPLVGAYDLDTLAAALTVALLGALPLLIIGFVLFLVGQVKAKRARRTP